MTELNYGLMFVFGLAFVSLLIDANRHGKIKEGKHNFWISLWSTALSIFVYIWIAGWSIYSKIE